MAHDRAQRELLDAKEELLRCALLNIEQLQTGCNSLRRERDQWKARAEWLIHQLNEHICWNGLTPERVDGFMAKDSAYLNKEETKA